MAKDNSTKKYQVHSLERGLDLIEILAQGDTDQSLTDLCKKAGFNMTTAHRIMNALQSRGYVRKMPSSKKYRLSYKVFELGALATKNLSLAREADPILRELADQANLTTFLLIVDNREALCLRRIDRPDVIQIIVVNEGGRMALHTGAAPRVLLAHLPEVEIDEIIEEKKLVQLTDKTITDPELAKTELKKIREQGYVLSIGDVVEGVFAIGCPIRNGNGEVVAAISISGIFSQFNEAKLNDLIQKVKTAGEKLSQNLNYLPE